MLKLSLGLRQEIVCPAGMLDLALSAHGKGPWANPWKDAKGEARKMDDQMNQYELVYIIQPELDEEETKAVDERVAQAIAGNNGQILSTEIWGQRKLAYPIRNFFNGYYILHNVEMPPSAVAEVERSMRLSEDIIRFLVVRTNK